MNFTVQQEIKLKVVDHAGQVALEFLRANPDSEADSAVTNYNHIFKQVYNHMLEVTK